MKNILTRTGEGKVCIELKKESCQWDAVYATAHKLADRFVVFIEPSNIENVGVYIEPIKRSFHWGR